MYPSILPELTPNPLIKVGMHYNQVVSAEVEAAGYRGTYRIVALLDWWKTTDNWWGEEERRTYYLVTTACGHILKIYRDDVAGLWYLSGYGGMAFMQHLFGARWPE